MINKNFLKKMFKVGSQFGHKKQYWNPKMKNFIFGSFNKIHIINLKKTFKLFKTSLLKIKNIIKKNKKILFVGTKRIAKKIIKKTATKSNQYYINNRWLGGLLTNWKIIKMSIKKLNKVEYNDKEFKEKTKKEIILYKNKINKLKKNLIGIKDMKKLPNAIFVIDANHEKIAIKEAISLGIKIFCIIDTDSNPEGIDYLIPSNDDSIKTIELYLNKVSNTIIKTIKENKFEK